MKNTTLTAYDLDGYETKKGVKTFEVCLDHEPTTDEIFVLQTEAGKWQTLKVIKLRPTQTRSEKMYNGKFWSFSFAVHENDWLFWCGFCAGKNWGMVNQDKNDSKKRLQTEMGQWIVQI